jgi:hypothetical protein
MPSSSRLHLPHISANAATNTDDDASAACLHCTDCTALHCSVGKNAFWLLDWTPTKEGVLRPDHITRYTELGEWLHECYSTPIVASAAGSSATSLSVTVPEGHEVDRVVLQEDLTGADGNRLR